MRCTLAEISRLPSRGAWGEFCHSWLLIEPMANLSADRHDAPIRQQVQLTMPCAAVWHSPTSQNQSPDAWPDNHHPGRQARSCLSVLQEAGPSHHAPPWLERPTIIGELETEPQVSG